MESKTSDWTSQSIEKKKKNSNLKLMISKRKPSLDSIEKVLSQSPGKTFRKMLVNTTSPLANSKKKKGFRRTPLSHLSPRSSRSRSGFRSKGLVMLEDDMENLSTTTSSPTHTRDRSLSVEGQRIEDMLLSIVSTPKHKTKTKRTMTPVLELKEEEEKKLEKREEVILPPPSPPNLKKEKESLSSTPKATVVVHEDITPPRSPQTPMIQQQRRIPVSPGVMSHPIPPLMAPPMSPMMWYGPPSPIPPHIGAMQQYHHARHHQYHQYQHHPRHHQYHHQQPSPQQRYVPQTPTSPGVLDGRTPTLNEIVGQVWKLSNGQRGCRLLQQILSSDSSAMEVLLRELRPHLLHLMKAPFGNYLFQKMVEVATPAQLSEIVRCVSPYIASVSSHVNGTRSTQKIIMTCEKSHEISAIVHGLQGNIPSLSVSSQGTHVVMRCLECFPDPHRGVIVDCVLGGFDVVVRNSHGCRIIQICFDLATRKEKNRMVDLIVKNANILAKHERANYAVQHVLKNGSKDDIEAVAKSFRGSYVALAKQKFASNVVEVCLRVVTFETKMKIVNELIDGVKYLLFDQFANYVVQNALAACRDQERAKFVRAIKPYARRMREDPSGKRILQKIETTWAEYTDAFQ